MSDRSNHVVIRAAYGNAGLTVSDCSPLRWLSTSLSIVTGVSHPHAYTSMHSQNEDRLIALDVLPGMPRSKAYVRIATTKPIHRRSSAGIPNTTFRPKGFRFRSSRTSLCLITIYHILRPSDTLHVCITAQGLKYFLWQKVCSWLMLSALCVVGLWSFERLGHHSSTAHELILIPEILLTISRTVFAKEWPGDISEYFRLKKPHHTFKWSIWLLTYP